MTSVNMRDLAQHRLLLLTAILFFSYLCVAIPLPTVPIFVAEHLRLGNVWAGLAVGFAFFATIVTRGHAGTISDRRGCKVAVVRGLIFYVSGALVSLVAGLPIYASNIAYIVLLIGRVLIGLGESLVGVGVIAWGVGLVGPARSGKVLALVGAAIYGALAVGGPVGLFLVNHIGFSGAMAVSAVIPCLGLAVIARLAAIAPHAHADRPPFSSVMGRIWIHGSIVCLQGIGFASIGAFFALDFLHQHWNFAGLGLTAFGAGFVLVRVCFGHLPDRAGALTVATVSLAIEAVGQILIWLAPNPTVALVGAFLTGLGCSLIFPAMGRLVVYCVEPHLRGAALGGFAAFQDLAYGLTGPLAGWIADRGGYDSVFFVGFSAAAMGFVVTLGLRRTRHVALAQQ